MMATLATSRTKQFSLIGGLIVAALQGIAVKYPEYANWLDYGSVLSAVLSAIGTVWGMRNAVSKNAQKVVDAVNVVGLVKGIEATKEGGGR
jgi:hypothetical protein